MEYRVQLSVKLGKQDRREYTRKKKRKTKHNESELRKSLERRRYQDGREVTSVAIFNIRYR